MLNSELRLINLITGEFGTYQTFQTQSRIGNCKFNVLSFIDCIFTNNLSEDSSLDEFI